jgi:dihydrofolate reductase
MLSSTGEGNLWIVGGGNVASQFADEGLLNEVLVTVVPVVPGDGKPLFKRRLAGGPMRLVGVLPRASGMVELRYEQAIAAGHGRPSRSSSSRPRCATPA